MAHRDQFHIRNVTSAFGAIAEVPFAYGAQLCWGCDDPTARLTTSASEQPFYPINVCGRNRVERFTPWRARSMPF
jgi:hypothetical protein